MPTPAVRGMVGTSCEFLARAPGVLIAPAHRTCLVTVVEGLGTRLDLACNICCCQDQEKNSTSGIHY